MNSSQVRYHIHFGGHRYAKDAESLKELLVGTNLYLPECLGWDGTYRDYFRRVSGTGIENLREKAEAKGQGITFTTQILEYLNKSKIEVDFADVQRTRLYSRNSLSPAR